MRLTNGTAMSGPNVSNDIRPNILDDGCKHPSYVLHEINHVIDARISGVGNYVALAKSGSAGVLDTEHFVYNMIRERHWDQLSEAEQLSANLYITSLDGLAR